MMRQVYKSTKNDTLTPSSLLQRITERTARVGVIGLGYVGVPTMVAAAQAGFKVTGIDINRERVGQINCGISYIQDVPSGVLAPLVKESKICSTTDYRVVADLDVIIICVPTPVDKHKEPELGPLQDAVHNLSKHVQGQQLIVLQSTTFPGTTEELVLPQLQKSGRRVGEDFYLVFSPERIDHGNQKYLIHNIPKVVGGVTPRCAELAAAFFASFVERVIPVSSPKVAEMTKLLENVFRSVNIALVNELSEVCQRMDIDLWEVIHAASTKPFGYMPFYPGLGVGGHCIPVDPFYLSWKAKEYDCYVNFIDLAARINDNQPYHVVSRIADVLGEQGKPLNQARLLLLGLSFKKNIKDTRNSPALRVAELLTERGAEVSYSDQHVPEVILKGQPVRSVGLDESALQQHDAIIILVNHSYFDLEKIAQHSKLVIDAVDATRPLGTRPTIIRL
jgi:UDP-N-acetyl-D-glucosamine dehydrogenase